MSGCESKLERKKKERKRKETKKQREVIIRGGETWTGSRGWIGNLEWRKKKKKENK
jgi:hypothetical protein